MAARAVKWTCSRCGVSVGRIDHKPADLPLTWTKAGVRKFCLSCSRALAGDMAMDSAPAGCSREDLVRIRRDALIEFEIGRAPEAPNGAIARVCHTSTAAVASIRAGLTDPTEGVAPSADQRDRRLAGGSAWRSG
jgi:hypothetical protein